MDHRILLISRLALLGVPWQTLSMTSKLLAFVLIAAIPFALPGSGQSPATSHDPSYTAEGELRLPENYRLWVYLSSGFDMSYNPAASTNQHTFDNVFVNPDSYAAFLRTGTWPDKTMLVLESRRAESNGSINKAGEFQGTSIMGLEIHIKDVSRFSGQWAFFGFGDSKTGKMIPTSASCYSCHAQHGAVDTTFVQFYPALLPVAAAKGTLSPAYVKETTDAAGSKDSPAGSR